MESQAAIIKILEDNSGEGQSLAWIKQISASSLLIPITSMPAVIVEDAEPAYESYNDNDQNISVSEKQNINVAVIIASENTNKKDFDNADYMTIKSDLKAKTNAIKDLLLQELQKVSGINGGSIGPVSIDDTKIDAEPVMMSTMPFSITIMK